MWHDSFSSTGREWLWSRLRRLVPFLDAVLALEAISEETKLVVKDIQSVVHTATHVNTLQRIATHCNTLQHTAKHCETHWNTAIHCNTLQHTTTHGNTRQHTATHGNAWQHTATHGNTRYHNGTLYWPYLKVSVSWTYAGSNVLD